MISVNEALEILRDLSGNIKLPQENVPIGQALGRTIAVTANARCFVPPADVSAMDGYAVKLADAKVGAMLLQIGESAAGAPFTGSISQGQCTRIFTGAYLPAGADHVVMQEDTTRNGENITLTTDHHQARHIRRRGIDIDKGAQLAAARRKLTAGDLLVLASGNVATVTCYRRPKVALIASGDELKLPGDELAPGQIVSSTPYGMKALLAAWGAEVVDLGIARDEIEDVCMRLESDYDLVIPLGGASVGDRDIMRQAFSQAGFDLAFEKIAVKPGKPTWAGRREAQLVLGLPGNPASALVCAHLFVKPLLAALHGRPCTHNSHLAVVDTALPANGNRENWLRALMRVDDQGRVCAAPVSNQDSSLVTPFQHAKLLLQRPANAPALKVGDTASVLWLDL